MMHVECPHCHGRFPLDPQDVGQWVQCPCGQMFVASEAGAAAEASEIPVTCSECGAAYVVDRAYAGQQLQCECGQSLDVPAPPETSAEPAGPLLVNCPECGAQYEADAGDVGAEAECQCGCIFTVQADLSEQVAAPDDAVPELLVEAADDRRGAAAVVNVADEPQGEQEEPQTAEPLPPPRRRSRWLLPGLVLSGLAVVLLVVVLAAGIGSPSQKSTEPTAPSPGAKAGPASQPPARSGPAAVADRPHSSQLAQVLAQAKQSNQPDQTTEEQGASQSKPAKKPPAQPAGGTKSDGTAKKVDRPRRGRPAPAAPASPGAALPRPPARPVVALRKPARLPRRFDDAVAEAYRQYKRMEELKQKADKSKRKADITAYHEQLGLAAGTLREAMQLVDEQTDWQKLLQARYLLGYLYYLANHPYEAAVLCQWVARWADAKDAIAKDAAMIALSALMELCLHAGPQEDVDGELHEMERLTRLIESRWPKHPKLNDIRINLAQLYQARGQTRRAADWFAQVTDASDKYALAQLAAGRGYWAAYLDAVRQQQSQHKTNYFNQDKQPAADATGGTDESSRQTQQLLQLARKLLTRGIRLVQADRKTTPPDSLYAAKLAKAQIHLQQKQFDQAVTTLTAQPFSVTKAIAADDSARPEHEGIKSRAFARSVYQTLLAAYLKLEELEKAEQMIVRLQRLAGPGDQPHLVEQHLELAHLLRKKLHGGAVSEKAAKDRAQLARMLDGFLQSGNQLPAGALLWIAETAGELAEQAAGDQQRRMYRLAAQAYARMLAQLPAEDESRLALMTRQAKALRQGGQFAEALAVLTRILDNRPNIFDLQFEAAYAIQQWGEQSDDKALLLEAITGPPTDGDQPPPVWGWARLASVLWRLWLADPGKTDYHDRFLEARYHIAWCRYQWALSAAEPSAKREMLSKAQRELKQLAAMVSKHDNPRWKQLDQIYRDIQRQLGQSPQPLVASQK